MNQKAIFAVWIVAVALMIAGVAGYYAYAKGHSAPVPNPVVTVATSTQPAAASTTTTTTTTIVTPVPVSHPVPPAPSGSHMITQSDNGKTVTFTKGDRFGIAMGDTLQWSLSLDPSGIVTRVPNIMTLRGEQGVYTATAVGTTTLHATGAPICTPGQACPQFRQEVTVNIVVKPSPIATSTTGTVSGSVLLSPICPVERNPPDPACAPKGYQTSIRILVAATHTLYTTISSDASGAFRTALPPGKYLFAPQGGSAMLPRCSETAVTVVANQNQTLNLDCDTGIR